MDSLLRIVSVSGGKDSTALYCWAVKKWGKDGFMAVFADTGHEHPVTYNYVRNLPDMANGPQIHWVKSDITERMRQRNKEPTGNPFLDMMVYKGRAPSTKAQFCTEILKLNPIRDWINAIRAEKELDVFLGIRAEESTRRAKMPEREFSDFYDGYINRPLLHWSKEQIFIYLNECGVPPNPLYALGYGRVGCFPCIHANKTELSLLPDWAWDKLAEWEKRVGRTWFPPGMVPGVHIPTISEVREWCKTDRGGRQFNIFSPSDAKDVPSCMSTWGICE